MRFCFFCVFGAAHSYEHLEGGAHSHTSVRSCSSHTSACELAYECVARIRVRSSHTRMRVRSSLKTRMSALEGAGGEKKNAAPSSALVCACVARRPQDAHTSALLPQNAAPLYLYVDNIRVRCCLKMLRAEKKKHKMLLPQAHSYA